MFAALVAFLTMLAFSIFLIILFQAEIIQIVINIPILWITVLRSQAHIKKEGKAKYYWIALIITTILFLVLPIAKNSLKIYLWWPTLFIIIMFILANIIVFIQRLVRRPEEE